MNVTTYRDSVMPIAILSNSNINSDMHIQKSKYKRYNQGYSVTQYCDP